MSYHAPIVGQLYRPKRKLEEKKIKIKLSDLESTFCFIFDFDTNQMCPWKYSFLP